MLKHWLTSSLEIQARLPFYIVVTVPDGKRDGMYTLHRLAGQSLAKGVALLGVGRKESVAGLGPET